jgi:hypothetical protein
MFGKWRAAEYSKMMVLRDRGESLTILAEDLMGKSVKITLLARDGDLEAASCFLANRVHA